jgi:hypothetical protein
VVSILAFHAGYLGSSPSNGTSFSEIDNYWTHHTHLRVGRPEGKRADRFLRILPKKGPINTEFGTPTLRRTDRRYQKGTDDPLDSAAKIGAPAGITYILTVYLDIDVATNFVL